MTAYSLATAAASAMGTLTVAAHQVLVGVVTVAQFCPEPLSACAQSELASVASKRGSNGRFGKHTQTRAGAVSPSGARGSVAAAARWAAAWRVYATSRWCASRVFRRRARGDGGRRGGADRVRRGFAYALVCVMDGLIFASGRMMFAAGASIATCRWRRRSSRAPRGGASGSWARGTRCWRCSWCGSSRTGSPWRGLRRVREWDGKETSKASRRR